MPALTAPAETTSRRLQRRRRLTPLDIAGMLDERLYDPRLSAEEFVARCRAAADCRAAAVICPGSRVALAAHLLAGSGVRVCAPPTDMPYPADSIILAGLLAQTEKLLHDGAREIALLTSPVLTAGAARTTLAKRIAAVAAMAESQDVIVKVILPAASLTRDQLTTACKISVDSGATMLQGGTWLDSDRASLSQMTQMRQAAGDHVLLKWAAPVRSLDRLLIACAEGVDRFNADTTTVLAQAADRARSWEIRVPEPGQDY
jgi:deoxyribose-phosphate aldolase